MTVIQLAPNQRIVRAILAGVVEKGFGDAMAQFLFD
jgi:hypothetical protein